VDAPPTFGQLLRRARRAAGLTQEALAERAGISARAVIDLERGVNRAPRRDTLEMLATALDLPPDERAHWERLRHRLSLRTTPSPPSSPARPAAPLPPLTSLPAEFDVLIGRDDDRTSIGLLLETRRLITLTGPGGIGKTRLAIAVGHDVAGAFPAGVFLVDLAPVNDAGMVVPAIAQALSVRETPGQSLLASLAARFSVGRLLLILDNLEHIAGVAPVIRELLAAYPQVVVLATSRTRLHLRGEQVYPVAALPTPSTDLVVTEATLNDFGATALFLRRAVEIKPDLHLTNDAAVVIAAICRRLDGIPLAIELATARCRVLSLPAILDRLTVALDLLADESADLPQRHRTLRETIAWSEALLSPDERTMFRRLSIFNGGWTLEAAEAVVGDLDIAVLDGLTSLVDHSLVTQMDQPDGSIRFRFLEPIRAFASEQLERGGETAAISERHAEWFLRFAERRDDMFSLAVTERHGWLEQLAADHDNLRQALHWYAEDSQPERLLRLSASLAWFWNIRGHLSEGRSWLELALQPTTETPHGAQATALLGLGILAGEQGDWEAAASALSASLARYEALDNQRGVTLVQNSQGILAARQGDRQSAIALFSSALERASSLKLDPYVGDLLNNLGVMSIQAGDVDEARRLYEESLAYHRAAGLQHHQIRVTVNLGVIALDQGRWDDAERLIEDALAMARAFGDRVSIVTTLSELGTLALQKNRYDEALSLQFESLTVARDIGYPDGVASALEGLAILAISLETFTSGIRLLAAAATFREMASVPNYPQDATRTATFRTAAQSSVGDDAFAREWAAGTSLSLDEAIALARSIAEQDDSGLS